MFRFLRPNRGPELVHADLSENSTQIEMAGNFNSWRGWLIFRGRNGLKSPELEVYSKLNASARDSATGVSSGCDWSIHTTSCYVKSKEQYLETWNEPVAVDR